MSDPNKTVDKEDSELQTKRKKQLLNMTGGQNLQAKEPKVSWSQTDNEVTISMKIEGMRNEQLKQLDIQFSDTDVCINLPDERQWICNLSGEIYREKSKVRIKKGSLIISIAKKKSGQWETLEEPDEIQEVSSTDINDEQSQKTDTKFADEISDPLQADPALEMVSPLAEDSDNVKMLSDDTVDVKSESEPGLDVGEENEDDDSEVFEKEEESEPGLDVGEENEDDDSEVFEKEEEPVVELQHVKHDYIEKDSTFVVHIYVKGVSKDNLMVVFEPKTFRVKFQTSHEQFLKLHKDSTGDTKFRWMVNLREEVIADKCSFKVTSSYIELSLHKKEARRWGDLEALKRRETTAPKAESWVPLGNVKTASEPEKLDRQVMFDEMKQNIERQNLSEKAADSGPVSSQSVDSAQPKPTCKVQPLSKQPETKEQVVTPGYTGLDNLGNTCFMNGVLQCLANTREFRDFFLGGDFQKDLNTDNVLGSGGKLAVSFAVLMRVLWSGKYSSYPPSKLKNLVAQKASQFTGFAQHDSQEFLAFLLDGLHEDLNRIKKKPYTETVEDRGRPDDVVANEAWDVHKKRNDSFVVDLFQGQYKSKLVCPVCGKVSITFDPFLYLSLPLPKRQRLLPVTFMWKDPYKKPVRYMLRLSKEATVEQLKDALQKKTGVNPENIRVYEAYKGRIHKIFKRGSSLSNVQSNDLIIGCEVYSKQIAGEPVFEVAVVQRTLMPNQFPSHCHSCKKLCPEGSKLKRCTKCYKVGYCDQTCQKHNWHYHKTQCKLTPDPVGTPFIISVPESRATFSKLCQLMEAYARYSVDVFQPPVKVEPPPKLSSQPSSSSLSNSSQSSGSLNSLDSQSSFSSSCTITAEHDQNIEDADMPPEVKNDNEDVAMMTEGSIERSNCDTSIEEAQGQTISGPTNVIKTESESRSVTHSDIVSIDSGYKSLPDTGLNLGSGDTSSSLTTDGVTEKEFVSPVKPVMGIQSGDAERTTPMFYLKPVNSEGVGLTGPDGERLDDKGSGDTSSTLTTDGITEKEFVSPVKPVMGIQSGDAERTTPMFYLKPVNSEGVGLTGPDGERLDDKGDVALDLTGRPYLSVDWKNNDKLSGYVLVQSKEMESDNDSSMMTASLEENTNVTLDQCLDLFTEPEVLAPEEAWYCPQCKEHREATKQLSTWKLPHTLIIQLKRFSFRNFIWRDKIDKMVDFPTRGLDLSHYYVGNRPLNEPPPIYDLYGVVNHHGGILGGHYTSYVRCADLDNSLKNDVGWRLCDDSRVSSISHEKNVLTRAAYLLFYRRREAFTPPPLSQPIKMEETMQTGSSDANQEVEEDSKSNRDIYDSLDSGELIIDTSEKVGELPDLNTFEDKDEGFEEVGGVPYITLDDEADLGYTDMDSVD